MYCNGPRSSMHLSESAINIQDSNPFKLLQSSEKPPEIQCMLHECMMRPNTSVVWIALKLNPSSRTKQKHLDPTLKSGRVIGAVRESGFDLEEHIYYPHVVNNKVGFV